MIDIDLINREINELENIANEIENLGSQLLDEAELTQIPDPDGINMGLVYFEYEKVLDPNLKTIQREAIRSYQKFYIAGLHFIKEFLPEKQHEFLSCYECDRSGAEKGVIDYLRLHGVQYTDDVDEIMHSFIDKLETQRSILLAIPFIARIKEINLREIISVEFIEREIGEAELLFENHPKAAGVLAGIALEKHLEMLCDKHDIEYTNKETIDPLAQKVRGNDKIDVVQLKKIQYLGSIRNKCSHRDEIKLSEVKELIERVKKLISIF